MMFVIFGLFGLAIGSFLNVVIYRLPKNESIVFPSSNCPKCHKNLKFYHNIPLISWLLLGGKCAFCKEKISLQYPLVEFLCMCLFVVCYLVSNTLLDACIYSLVFSLLLALSLIDLRYKAVPDTLSIPALIIALFAGDMLTNIQEALMYAGGFALLRIIVSFLIKKEAMGEADIIIAAIIGGVLGTPLGLVAIYLSAIFALIGFLMVKKSGFELPFIPFLSLGLFLTFVFDTFWLEIIGNIYG